ncbi:unnamed protein product [Citrullus colocynthis]|uniref:Reverse transcriptase domain-containing protein n=1 Tax=Citrullus colocynthis TaxID=252529 RepID=A0ABP0Z7Z3_9ROSI
MVSNNCRAANCFSVVQLKVTHLLFADDILFFSEFDIRKLRNLKQPSQPDTIPDTCKYTSSKLPWFHIAKLQGQMLDNLFWKMNSGEVGFILVPLLAGRLMGALKILLTDRPMLFVREAWDPLMSTWNILCGLKSYELVEHLFIKCEYTSSFWNQLGEEDNLPQFQSLQSLVNYLILLKTNSKPRTSDPIQHLA